MFGVTQDVPGLRVGFAVFNTSGIVGSWALGQNYDGNSYQLPLTFETAGAFSVKKVVFLNIDTDFTQRDPDYFEADDAIQVVNVAGGEELESAVMSVDESDEPVLTGREC